MKTYDLVFGDETGLSEKNFARIIQLTIKIFRKNWKYCYPCYERNEGQKSDLAIAFNNDIVAKISDFTN